MAVEILNGLGRMIFLLLNRKSFKKYFNGELEPTKEELEKIHAFLQTRISGKFSGVSETISYAQSLERQIEQKKIPYLQELPPEELDFLLKHEIDLDMLLDVVYAKSTSAKGFASIAWCSEKGRYTLKTESISIKTAAIILCLAVPFILIWLATFEEISFKVYGINLFPVSALIFFFFFIFPSISVINHTDFVAKKLLKNHPELFDCPADKARQ